MERDVWLECMCHVMNLIMKDVGDTIKPNSMEPVAGVLTRMFGRGTLRKAEGPIINSSICCDEAKKVEFLQNKGLLRPLEILWKNKLECQEDNYTENEYFRPISLENTQNMHLSKLGLPLIATRDRLPEILTEEKQHIRNDGVKIMPPISPLVISLFFLLQFLIFHSGIKSCAHSTTHVPAS
eukprot:GHVP01020821.1.p1 GENE.GHVP01020821.1~~GHVP01020821.1.p1  ORF type:complete len:182 (-),score=29.53 GHVP01020821.1:544-1089(-)